MYFLTWRGCSATTSILCSAYFRTYSYTLRGVTGMLTPPDRSSTWTHVKESINNQAGQVGKFAFLEWEPWHVVMFCCWVLTCIRSKSVTCPAPSSLQRSMAKARSMAANTASASPACEWRMSCRRLSYMTGSKNAKSCQFTCSNKMRRTFSNFILKCPTVMYQGLT